MSDYEVFPFVRFWVPRRGIRDFLDDNWLDHAFFERGNALFALAGLLLVLAPVRRGPFMLVHQR